LPKKPINEANNRLLCCMNTALQRKAKDLVAMKVKAISSFADYFIICSGTSDRQVRSIANWIEETLKKVGMPPLGVEGVQNGQWVLMDYGDIVIHIFYEPIRAFYDIERLWSDAPKMAVDDDTLEIKALPEDMAD
jgi:ribosome-associated protein